MNLYWSIAVAVISLFMGWHTHTWYDGYKGERQAVIAERKAAAGETKIIQDTQIVTKEIQNDKKDGCLNDTVPAPELKQLQ